MFFTERGGDRKAEGNGDKAKKRKEERKNKTLPRRLVRRGSRSFCQMVLRVEIIFERFAEFENGLLAGSNFNLFFGLRVDTGLSGYVFDFKRAEADKLNFVTGFERFRHRSHKRVISDRRVLVGKAGFSAIALINSPLFIRVIPFD